MKGPSAVGTGASKDREVPLREIIDQLNARFGTEFTPNDQLLLEQVIADGLADAQVQARAGANTFENFALASQDTIEGLMIDRMDRNAGLVTKFLNEDDFKRYLSECLARRIYDDLRKTGS